MSTKQTTDSTNTLNYDPNALSTYKQLISGGGNVLSQYMNNPFGNAFYNMGLGQSMAGANQLGQQNINTLSNNMAISGLGGNSGNAFQQAMLSNIGRGNQSIRSQANIGNVMNALQRQMTATGMGMSFSPLLTGQKGQTTQTQSGLGTWLPQLLGTAASAGMAGLTGGASLAFPGMSAGQISGKFGGPTSAPTTTMGGGFGMLPMPGGQQQAPQINPLMFGSGSLGGYGS